MEKNTKNIIIFLTNLWRKVQDFTFKTEVINQIEIPEVNIPEVNFPEYPSDIRVNNIDEVKRTIEGNTDKVLASLSKELKNLIPKDNNKKVVKELRELGDVLDVKDLTPEVIAELKKIVKLSNRKDVDLTTIENSLESLKYILGEVKRYDEIKVRLPDKQVKKLSESMATSYVAMGAKNGTATESTQKKILNAVGGGTDVSLGTSTAVSVGATSTTIIASNANRKSITIVNDSDEEIYLKYGTTAVMNSGGRLNAKGGTLEEDDYTGIITGISLSGTKNVTVTELV